jgi:hypothetical protein
MTPSENDPKNSGTPGGPLKSLFTAIIYAFAFLAAIVVKPAQALTKATYTKNGLKTYTFFAGVILSIVASIGTGYFAFKHAAPLEWWLGAAVAAPFAVYFYLWPLTYLAIGKWTFRFSRFIWGYVADLEDREPTTPKWLTMVLSVSGTIASAVSCLYLFWLGAVAVHNWLGWGGISAWAIGVLVGGITAFVCASALISLIWKGGMAAVSLISGTILVHFFGYDAAKLLPLFSHGFVSHGFVSHAGKVAQVLLWAAYLFPLLHILVSRLFGWVGHIFDKFFEHVVKAIFDFIGRYFGKLRAATYGERDQAYLGLLRQALAIAVSAYCAYHAFTYVHALSFGTGLWLAAPASALAALLLYIATGFLFSELTPSLFGMLTAILAVYGGFSASHNFFHLFGGRVSIAIVAGLASAVLTVLVFFPLVYQLVRLFLKPLVANWLGLPLVQMHAQIAEQVLSSIDETYDEDTAYGPFFIQVVNIAVALASFFLTREVVLAVHLHGTWALALPLLLPLLSYLFIGRLLTAYKTILIGLLGSLAAGAFAGVKMFAHFHHSLWYAVPSFVAAGLAFAFVFFPVAYVVVRAILEVILVSRWAAPALVFIYDFAFSFVARGWAEFATVYRRIAISFAPIWAQVSKTWDEAWSSAREIFEKAFNGKKK